MVGAAGERAFAALGSCRSRAGNSIRTRGCEADQRNADEPASHRALIADRRTSFASVAAPRYCSFGRSKLTSGTLLAGKAASDTFRSDLAAQATALRARCEPSLSLTRR